MDIASFFFPSFSTTWLRNSFFFPPIFSNLVATIHIFSLLIPTISVTWLPQLFSLSGTPPSLGTTRISVISVPKFNFLSPLTHCTFSCNFGNTIAEIQSLFSFSQITLNSTYNTNKLRFLQYLAKRLEIKGKAYICGFNEKKKQNSRKSCTHKQAIRDP